MSADERDGPSLSSEAREASVNGVDADDAGRAPSNTAAAVVLDKLASLDMARKAERDRRREESRAAADPRESVAQFLNGFTARQRSVEDALQRMLLQHTGSSPQTASAPAAHQQLQAQGRGDTADTAAAAAPAPLEVSTATPEAIQASLELLTAEVLSMEQSAAAASYYLPSYDQKQCAAAVAALRSAIEGARTSLAPRRRFAFGSKKVNKVRGEEISAAAATAGSVGGVSEQPPVTAPPAVAAAAGECAPAAAPQLQPATASAGVSNGTPSVAAGTDTHEANDSPDPNTTPAVISVSEQDQALVSRGRGLMGLTDAHIVLRADQVSEPGAVGSGGGSFVLLGLTRCRVVLLGRLQALRAVGLRGCSVVAGPVTGSVFLDDVRGCSLALAAYQVRVHRTHATDLFLRVRSKPIIEHTSAVRVAPWAAAVGPEPRLQALLGQHLLAEDTGSWQQVEDFNWIKADQSPNWRVMQPQELPAQPLEVPPEVWEPQQQQPQQQQREAAAEGGAEADGVARNGAGEAAGAAEEVAGLEDDEI
ncbi:hypothetical protein Agub_g1194 [Astrephomene gubernaculifera]|uniref:C-CAP/cofactor C-like domain-containing protein n=1 Tax=Astrephomene gubernaculifera TaxID=47775 RepID=A0AAD3DH71_9CHLO|nr:hypothetical protein Agub_g1194 [Astrephomene gubernaculifera]